MLAGARFVRLYGEHGYGLQPALDRAARRPPSWKLLICSSARSLARERDPGSRGPSCGSPAPRRRDTRSTRAARPSAPCSARARAPRGSQGSRRVEPAHLDAPGLGHVADVAARCSACSCERLNHLSAPHGIRDPPHGTSGNILVPAAEHRAGSDAAVRGRRWQGPGPPCRCVSLGWRVGVWGDARARGRHVAFSEQSVGPSRTEGRLDQRGRFDEPQAPRSGRGATLASKRYVLSFTEFGIDDVPLVGGKNASLGEMYRRSRPQGVRVPNGFAITAEAYRDVLDEAGAWPSAARAARWRSTRRCRRPGARRAAGARDRLRRAAAGRPETQILDGYRRTAARVWRGR